MNQFFKYILGLSKEPNTVVNKYIRALDINSKVKNIDLWYEREVQDSNLVTYTLKCSADTEKDENGKFIVGVSDEGKPYVQGENLITEPELMWSGQLFSEGNTFGDLLSRLLIFDPIISRDSPPENISSHLFYQAVRRVRLLEDLENNYPCLDFNVRNVGTLSPSKLPRSDQLGMRYQDRNISAPHGLLSAAMNYKVIEEKKESA